MSAKNDFKTREPLIRMVKRAEMSSGKAWLIRGFALLIALILCGGFIFCITGLNPIAVFRSMFSGAFGTTRRSWVTIRDTMMLLCVSIGLAPAFRMKFWNIGAEGQILVGGIASAACMIYIGDRLPTMLLLLLMFIASCVAGGIWGLIPAIFKSKWNTNETLFTLMLNYVAIQLTSFCISLWENKYGSNTVGIINGDTHAGWFPKIFGMDYLLNVLIVLSLTVFMFFYLRSSKHGYEIAVVGDSENTARYAGMNVMKIVIRTVVLSGAICGIAGFLNVAGMSHSISMETSGGRGFTAIIVAWLSKFNTFVMILFSVLIVFLEKGSSQIASDFQLNDDASSIMTGIILFAVLASEFFINYHLIFRRRSAAAIDEKA